MRRANWPDHIVLPLPSRGLTWDDVSAIPFDEIFTAAPKDSLSLLRSMLVLDPNQRSSASQCLNHPYFLNQPAPTPKDKLPLA
jgi:cyclin-dependent kinase 7